MDINVQQGVGAKSVAVSGGFTNHGGPVVASPQIKVLFWGSSWLDTAHTAQASNLTQFLANLLNSSLMNLLAQYGVGSGQLLKTGFTDITVSGILTDSGIRQQLQKYFNVGSLPEPDGNQVHFIFLDESISVNDSGQGLVLCSPSGDTAFGYHNFFITSKGNPVYYAVVPSLSDACLQETCNGDPSCTLATSDTQEQRRTEVATHEFAELVTDPQLNAWVDNAGNEIGDVCAGQSQDVTVAGRTWRVQKEWDNAANSCTVGTAGPPPPKKGSSGNSETVIINGLMYLLARWLGKL